MVEPSTVKKVLIIEDEKPLSHALDLKLSQAGIVTTIASNGEDGLAYMLKEKFDVVLLDMMMPIMDGFQLLQILKTTPMPLPKIFALSNLSVHDDQTRALDAGVSKYFIKSDTPLSVIVEEIKNA